MAGYKRVVRVVVKEKFTTFIQSYCVHTNCPKWLLSNLPPRVKMGGIHKPKLIVFDLDRTLWPFQVDKDTTNPFRMTKETIVVDSKNRQFQLFPNVVEMLQKLTSLGFVLGVASRIEDIMGAYQLLELFGLNSLFPYKEIYPTSKVLHFRELSRKTGFPFESMAFFDDDERNIKAVKRLGVVTFLVPENGISEQFVLKCLNLDYSDYVKLNSITGKS